MSREIKFRVWNKNTNKYEYTELDYYFVIDQRIKAYEYEQYTGLKDKNGKEIYEGDIIKCHLSPISSVIFTGVVEFKPGCIMFKNFADNGSYAFNFLGAVEEVIGNIHENPELLEN